MKKKLSILNIILLAVEAVGLILAIVAVCVPWFASDTTVLGHTEMHAYGLFEIEKDASDFPLSVVQAFAIIGLIAAIAAAAVYCLEEFGILKFGKIVNIVIAVAVALLAILAMVFALVYVGQFGKVSAGGLASAEAVAHAGCYLLLAGGLFTAVPLALRK